MKTAFLGFAALTLAACSGATATTNPDPQMNPIDPSQTPMAVSAKARITTPTVAPADATALTAGNAAFATDLYKTLAADPAFASTNVFFSPHSISIALAMTYAGARTNTEKELAAGLHYTLSQDKLHPAFDALDLALSSRGAGDKASDGTPFRLRVTNSLWGSNVTQFEQPFLDTIAENYGAGVRLTDFSGDPEGSRGLINGWVSTETENKINDLIPSGAITADTRLVLVNAVYFNAQWKSVFDAHGTQPAPFHALDGSSPSVSMMAQSGTFPYAQGTGYQAVALPYQGDELSMIAVVPDAGTFAKFESGFTADKLATITTSLQSQEVNLALPKFKIEGASFSLKTALTTLGVHDAFVDGKADFSGIATEPLFVSDVIHKAFISVDESGTEAAAATAVIAAGAAAETSPPPSITIDRPFVFAIRDNATGAILFLGRVIKP